MKLNMYKKLGFTLAEVLITLTIIGIVAAMTIPTLMGKYQQRAMESQFKKTYSILNQAISQSQTYNCYSDFSLYESDVTACYDFWTNILEKIKYVKVEEKIYPTLYKTKAEVIDGGGLAPNQSCSGQFFDGQSYKVNKYYLADGSTLYLDNKESHATSLTQIEVIVDVNGDKGPNKWGYDAFFLAVIRSQNGSIKLHDGYCPITEKGGKRAINIITGTNKVYDESNWREQLQI